MAVRSPDFKVVASVFVSLALSALGGLASAQTPVDDFGPAIGAPAPTFSLSDSDGTRRGLEDLYGENGLVLYFNRSLDWCPICQRQTLEVDAAADGFAERGYAVAVLTYDPVEDLARFDLRRDVSLTLLSDAGSQVIDAWGVRDPVYDDPDSLGYGVPYPIAYVIGTDGIIRARFWHEAGLGQPSGWAMRSRVDAVFAALDALPD